jgi:O-antigen/teichoic acid export membrane protein
MVVGLSATIYLVVVARMGVAGVYMAMLINASIFACTAFVLARSSFAWAFSRARLTELLRFGVPLIPVAIAYYLIMYSDRYFLRYFHGLDTVGFFALGVRVSSVLALMLNGFQMAIGPFVYSHYKDEHAPETFSKTFDYVSVAVTLAFTAISLFAADIVMLFATPAYMSAHYVVPLLAAGTALYGLGSYFSFGIGIAKKTVHRAWTGALAAAINVALNILLVPKMGIIGAGVATGISLFLLAAMQMVISQGLYMVPYRFGRNLVIYVAAAAVVVITYSTGLDRSGLSLIPVKAVMIAGVLGVAVAVRLVSRTEFEYLRRLAARCLRMGR